MPRYHQIHPESPQARLLTQALAMVRDGGILVFPTDCCYAMGCHLGDKAALDRLRTLRGVDDHHHMTLMCRDLSDVAQYARVDNIQYRLLKAATPGSYTFILEATKDLPKRLMHPKRKTVGLRVPAHPVVQALLAELGEPLLTTTLLLPGEEEPMTEGWEIKDRLAGQVEMVLDGGHCGTVPTTVIDLTTDTPVLVRAGQGALAPFGLVV